MSIHNMKVAGIDTGKACLHVCLLPDNTGFTVANDAEGHATLVAKCREAGIVRAGIEATSIYHRPAVLALRAAGIEVAELQPRQARAYAQALLQWAKNDVIDAFVIARLTQALAEVRAAPDQAIAALAEALTYIEQLEERIVWLKTSIERFTSARFTARIQADIKALEKRRKVELRKLEATLRKDEKQSRRLDLLLGIPGIAERTALGFLIRMPELGSLSREQAARLAGLAPLDDDSGKHSGERHIYGGRSAKPPSYAFTQPSTGTKTSRPSTSACVSMAKPTPRPSPPAPVNSSSSPTPFSPVKHHGKPIAACLAAHSKNIMVAHPALHAFSHRREENVHTMEAFTG
jgi:transposase